MFLKFNASVPFIFPVMSNPGAALSDHLRAANRALALPAGKRFHSLFFYLCKLHGENVINSPNAALRRAAWTQQETMCSLTASISNAMLDDLIIN